VGCVWCAWAFYGEGWLVIFRVCSAELGSILRGYIPENERDL